MRYKMKSKKKKGIIEIIRGWFNSGQIQTVIDGFSDGKSKVGNKTENLEIKPVSYDSYIIEVLNSTKELYANSTYSNSYSRLIYNNVLGSGFKISYEDKAIEKVLLEFLDSLAYGGFRIFCRDMLQNWLFQGEIIIIKEKENIYKLVYSEDIDSNYGRLGFLNDNNNTLKCKLLGGGTRQAFMYYEGNNHYLGRGIPTIYRVKTALAQFERYENSIINAMELAAQLNIIFRDNNVDVNNEEDRDAINEDMKDISKALRRNNAFLQTITTLPSGFDVTSLGSNIPNANIADIMYNLTMKIASALGISAIELTTDYSRANFSSVRAAQRADNSTYSTLQKGIIDCIIIPIIKQWFLDNKLVSKFKKDKLKVKGFIPIREDDSRAITSLLKTYEAGVITLEEFRDRTDFNNNDTKEIVKKNNVL